LSKKAITTTQTAVIVIVILIAVIAGAYLATRPSAPPPPTKETTLVIAEVHSITSADPTAAFETTAYNVVYNCYDRLIETNGSDFSHVVQGLAENWTVSPDGMTYTFKLRQGVKFASGFPVNASAVKFSFDRVLEVNLAASWLFSDYGMTLNSTEVIDTYTVRVTLAYPYAAFLFIFAAPVASIVDPSVALAHQVSGDLGNGWMTDHSAGSGPFILASWVRESVVELDRNPNYWRGPAQLEKILINNVPEASSRKMLIEAEPAGAHLAFDLTQEQLYSMQNETKIKMVAGWFEGVEYVGMNTKMNGVTPTPFNDPKVRMAVKYAIDYRTITEDLLRGNGLRLMTPIPKGLLGHDPSIVLEQNTTRAKELLTEAGYPNGFSTTLTYTPGTVAGIPHETLVLKVQEDLAKIGIQVSLVLQPEGTMLNQYRGKKLEMMLMGWYMDFADPDDFVHPFGHVGGSLAKRVSYNNTEVSALVDQAATTSDLTQRAMLYEQIQQLLLQDGPWAILFQPRVTVAVRQNVNGYVYSPIADWYYPISIGS
jgi:peptide/nickel transport system substrate-binding protein